MSYLTSRTIARGAGLVLVASFAVSGEKEAKCWRGGLEMSTATFSSESQVTFIRLGYDIYQNKAGVIRLELKYSQPPLGKVTGIGRDVHLIDYAKGTLVAFDKDKPKAVRYRSIEGMERDPFAAPHERLAPMRILGRRCKGAMRRSESNGQTELRETWAASEEGFRYPLLDITRTIAGPEAARSLGVPEGLLSLTLRTITRLEKVEDLDDALFQVPPGYEVIDVGEPGQGG